MALGIGGIGTGGTGGSWSNLYPRRLVDKVPSYKKKKNKSLGPSRENNGLILCGKNSLTVHNTGDYPECHHLGPPLLMSVYTEVGCFL